MEHIRRSNFDTKLRNAKITNKALAEHLGVKKQTVSTWISGTRNISPIYMRAIIEYTNGVVTADDLIPQIKQSVQ